MRGKKWGFDLLRQQYIDRLDERLEAVEEWAPGDTPIEQLFLASLILFIEAMGTEFDGILVPPDQQVRDRLLANEKYQYHLLVERQALVGDWRVDYIVCAWTHGSVWTKGVGRQDGAPRWRKLIVECDGHDFHERTKEQASRDRSRDRNVAAEGYDIFRFTGSELWRDPWSCAEQVYDWAARGTL